MADFGRVEFGLSHAGNRIIVCDYPNDAARCAKFAKQKTYADGLTTIHRCVDCSRLKKTPNNQFGNTSQKHTAYETLGRGKVGVTILLSQPRKDCSRCHYILKNDYKFYLSFENSICKDYVSEKVYDRMPHYVVPIVLNRTIAEKILPEHSFIAADDFSSPKQLAAYLHYLDRNTSEYLKYFEWRTRFYIPRVKNIRTGLASLCSLCHKLLQTSPPKSYPDLHKWWHTDANCVGKWPRKILLPHQRV